MKAHLFAFLVASTSWMLVFILPSVGACELDHGNRHLRHWHDDEDAGEDDEDQYKPMPMNSEPILFEHDTRPLHRRLNRGDHTCSTRLPSEEDVGRALQAEERYQRRRLAESDIQKSDIVVDVYFHIMQASELYEDGAFSDEDINFCMDFLNQEFEASRFRFRLQGVTRTIDRQFWECGSSEEFEFMYKSKLRRGSIEAINFFLCNLIDFQGSSGYSYYPPDIYKPEDQIYDGAVITHPYPRGADVTHTATTVVHEIGHALGLFHTWTRECTPGNKEWWKGEFDSYIIAGDGIKDTAAHIEPTGNYYGKLTCWQTKGKDFHNTCPDDRADEGIDPGFDPVLNHMNYVPQRCGIEYGSFTPLQFARMESQFFEFREGRCRGPLMQCTSHKQCCDNQICSSQFEPVSRCGKCHKKNMACNNGGECCGKLRCKKKRCVKA